MYYDLNIPWPHQFGASSGSSQPTTVSKKQKQKAKQEVQAPEPSSPIPPNARVGLSDVQFGKMKALTEDLRDLGYSTCAYNHIIQSKFDPIRHLNPFCIPEQPHQSIPPFRGLHQFNSNADSSSGKTRQLSRMTLILDEASMGKQGHGLTTASTSALLSYDLLSAQAFNDPSFSMLCLTLSELKPSGIDIISLDLSTAPRLPFFLKRSTVNAALANGVVFEICYSQVVNRGEADSGLSRARKNVISGARDILRITNGKGVIFSSGAMDIMGLRGPNDIINLASIFGLNPAAAKDAISSTCRSLILRAETRKTFRGAVGEPAVVAAGDIDSKTQTLKRKAEVNLNEENSSVSKKPKAAVVTV